MMIEDNNQIPNISGIYKITNLKNNKCYIGSAVKLRTRIKRHLYELNNSTHNNKHLLRSFNKYGVEMFNVEILKTFNNIIYTKLLKEEQILILKYNSIKNGYNQLLNNANYFIKLNKSKTHIESNRKKSSLPIMCFDRFTGEYKYNFDSITEAARFFNTSTSNISRVCKNKLNYIKEHTFCYNSEYDKTKDYSNPFYWAKNRKLSKSHLEKITLNNQNRLGRNIYQYDLNHNFINSYPSRAKGERSNNLKKESLRKKVDTQTPFEGYYWYYTKI